MQWQNNGVPLTNDIDMCYSLRHRMTHKPQPILHRYLFKASWGGTAIKFWVEAKNSDAARRKAEREVFRMEGGVRCLDLELIHTIS